MTNGIYLNGQPLDLKDATDIRIIQDAFEMHYIYKPRAAHNCHRSTLRRSPVRHLSALELAHMQEIQDSTLRNWYRDSFGSLKALKGGGHPE